MSQLPGRINFESRHMRRNRVIQLPG